MKALMSVIDFNPLELLILIVVAGISLFLLTTPYNAYAIFPSLVLLLMLILANYPQAGFYLIVILIPMSAIRQISETDPTLTITKFLGLGLFIIMLLHILSNKIKLDQLKSNLWPWFFIFLLIYMLSAMLSDYPMASFSAIERLLVSYIFFAITLAYIDPKRLISSLPKVIIIGVTFSSILGIVGTVFGVPFLIRDEAPYVRALGGNFDANEFSSYVILAFPLLVHYFLTTKKFQYRLFYMLLLIIYVLAIISTYSRGGLLVFSIVLLFLFFDYRHKFKVRTFGFVLLFIVLVISTIFIFTPTSYIDRIKSITETTDTSISRRQSSIDLGFDIFKENPILGTGPGTYSEEYAVSDIALVYSEEGDTYKRLKRVSHNTYIDVLTGTGAVGLLVFIIISGLSLKNFIDAKKQLIEQGHKKLASLISAYKISFLSVMMYFFMLGNLYYKQFWLLIAISYIAVILAKNIIKSNTVDVNN